MDASGTGERLQTALSVGGHSRVLGQASDCPEIRSEGPPGGRNVTFVPRFGYALCLVAGLTLLAACGSAHSVSPREAQRTFFTPGAHGASCEIDVYSPVLPTSAFCVMERGLTVKTESRAICVTLRPSGRIVAERGGRCVGNPPFPNPTVQYGHSVSLGPFRCTSLPAGVLCVVITTGRGFFLTPHHLTQLK